MKNPRAVAAEETYFDSFTPDGTTSLFASGTADAPLGKLMETEV